MHVPSDRYGDLDLEDLAHEQDELELEPEDYLKDGEVQELVIGNFERNEYRRFDTELEEELVERDEEDAYYDPEDFPEEVRLDSLEDFGEEFDDPC